MTRGNRGKPSPFRFVITPSGGTPKVVECLRGTQTLQGAKQAAKEWASDVGSKGSIAIEERVELRAAPWFSWKSLAVAEVANGSILGWR